jgi:drug/metabolite transporter (DMT)-like permease
MSYKTKLALLLSIILWASAFVGIRVGLHTFSPEGLALLRYLIASFCMTIIYLALPKTMIKPIFDKLALLGIGFIGIGLYNLTLNYGELALSSGMSSFIISQSPIITALFAMCFLGEKLNKLCLIGFIISVFGVFLITIGEKGGFKWDDSISYILVATLTAGFYSVLQKPFLKKYPVIEVTTYIIWGGTLFLTIHFPKLQQDLLNASIESSLMVVYLGVFPGAIGYLAWSYALSRIPASRAVSFLYFMPPIATLLGWMYLNEIPVWLSIAGAILAICGVWLVNQSYRQIKLLT